MTDLEFLPDDDREMLQEAFIEAIRSVPPSHADWLAEHLRNGEVIWVEGNHFGPRDEEEMELMKWVGGG